MKNSQKKLVQGGALDARKKLGRECPALALAPWEFLDFLPSEAVVCSTLRQSLQPSLHTAAPAVQDTSDKPEAFTIFRHSWATSGTK